MQALIISYNLLEWLLRLLYTLLLGPHIDNSALCTQVLVISQGAARILDSLKHSVSHFLMMCSHCHSNVYYCSTFSTIATSIDVLTSKNQTLCKYCMDPSTVLNDCKYILQCNLIASIDVLPSKNQALCENYTQVTKSKHCKYHN